MQTTQIEQLPCKLSPEELQLKSDAMAQAQAELEQLEVDKSSASSSFGAAIKKKKQEIAKYAKEVRTREEMRPVECVEKPRYPDLMVDLVRLDTGTKVSSRGMHPHERQSSLELGADLLPAPRNERPRKGKASASKEKRALSKRAVEDAAEDEALESAAH